MIRLDLSDTVSFGAHRSGWGYCMSKLAPFHSRNGVYFDSFIEKKFSWEIKSFYSGGNFYEKYNRDWVGVLHNPPNNPSWFDNSNSPQAIFQRRAFQEAMKTCKAIVCLSEYLSKWVSDKTDVPVVTVKHPTEIPRVKWDIRKYIKSDRKELVQIGYWLRKIDSIHKMRVGPDIKKIWLPSNQEYAMEMYRTLKRTSMENMGSDYTWAGVWMTSFSDSDFDQLLSRCVVFLDQYDSSANNAVVECVARNTPLITNRLPAVEEYLGKDYPLYFEDLDHASTLVYDEEKIYQAHLYLKNMDKRWISGTYFANDLISKLETVLS